MPFDYCCYYFQAANHCLLGFIGFLGSLGFPLPLGSSLSFFASLAFLAALAALASLASFASFASLQESVKQELETMKQQLGLGGVFSSSIAWWAADRVRSWLPGDRERERWRERRGGIHMCIFIYIYISRMPLHFIY